MRPVMPEIRIVTSTGMEKNLVRGDAAWLGVAGLDEYTVSFPLV
jgi:hypothetical protein